MKAKVRREYIADLVQSRELSVHELAERFGITTSTIRRDLAQLASEGRLLRTLAGAAPQSAETEDEYSIRQMQSALEKRSIAFAARRLVRDGSVIYIDAGTTCTALAEELVKFESLLVVTPSTSVVRALTGKAGIDVEMLGGRYRAISQACYGTASTAQLEQYVFDAVFTSADEISIEHGLREESAEQIDAKSAAFRRGRDVFVLADSSKFASTPRAGRWLMIPEGATVISDAPSPAALAQRPSLGWKQAELLSAEKSRSL